jgi:hypothetical protein
MERDTAAHETGTAKQRTAGVNPDVKTLGQIPQMLKRHITHEPT